jgi:hypothetical protein
MKHVQVPPDGEILPLDPTTIFFRPADDDPLPPHPSAVAIFSTGEEHARRRFTHSSARNHTDLSRPGLN